MFDVHFPLCTYTLPTASSVIEKLEKQGSFKLTAETQRAQRKSNAAKLTKKVNDPAAELRGIKYKKRLDVTPHPIPLP